MHAQCLVSPSKRAPCPVITGLLNCNWTSVIADALHQPQPHFASFLYLCAGPTICCSSPERFLRGGRGGVLEARPIKGTAPRVKVCGVCCLLRDGLRVCMCICVCMRLCVLSVVSVHVLAKH